MYHDSYEYKLKEVEKDLENQMKTLTEMLKMDNEYRKILINIASMTSCKETRKYVLDLLNK